jgi:integrase
MYGLRSGEVSRLQMDDFDWRAETFTVNHSKRGGAQQYPLLYEVGEAILEYIKEARPRASCRNLFLTLRPPLRWPRLFGQFFRVLKWKNCSVRRRGGGNVKIGFIDFQGLVGRAENSPIVFRPFLETGISTACWVAR